MRHFGLVLVMLLASIGQARADDSAMKDVIAAQIDAFQRDDFDDAFSFASPMIQGMFRTPTIFGGMVRNGYPMIHRPAGIRFGLTEDRNGRSYQYVTFEDQNGRTHVAEYEMIEIGGSWRINGVRLVPGGGVGA